MPTASPQARVEPAGVAATPRARQRRLDHVFFPAMAALTLGVVLVGFARTYFLAGVFAAPLRSWILHVHGAVFSSWLVLLVVQTGLVAGGRVTLHRRLGVLGFALAGAMILLGLLAATERLGRVGPGPAGADERAFFAIPVGDMLLFATLIGAGLRLRRRPAAHKRLVLLATVAILDAAFVRWPVPAGWWSLPHAQLVCYAGFAIVAGYDLLSTRRLQRVTLAAGALTVAVYQARLLVGATAPWQRFAGWLQGISHALH